MKQASNECRALKSFAQSHVVSQDTSSSQTEEGPKPSYPLYLVSIQPLGYSPRHTVLLLLTQNQGICVWPIQIVFLFFQTCVAYFRTVCSFLRLRTALTMSEICFTISRLVMLSFHGRRKRVSLRTISCGLSFVAWGITTAPVCRSSGTVSMRGRAGLRLIFVNLVSLMTLCELPVIPSWKIPFCSKYRFNIHLAS